MEELTVTREKKYFLGIDIIKFLAMFFVILVHSTTFYGYLYDDSISIIYIFSSFGRFLSYSCVPLFLIITGYLNSKKQLSFSHYKKIFVYLLEYILCCLVVWVFRGLIAGENFSFWQGIIKIFNFSMSEYAWYVSMFIKLFLIIPFLNILYKALKTKKQKTIFLIILIALIMIPSTIEFLNFGYCDKLYPIFYYFVGLYIHEFRPNFKKLFLTLFIIAICLLDIVLVRNRGLLSIVLTNYSNVFCMMLSIAIFLLFYNIPAKDDNNKALSKITKLSLSTFLVSYIFDRIFIAVLANRGIISFADRFVHLIYLVPLNFVFSVILALFIHLIMNFILDIVGRLNIFITKKFNKT